MSRHKEGAVLAAGLFVVVATAGVVYKGVAWRQQNVARSMCMSNLKQIGLGTIQYVRDFDEVFPRAQQWSDDLWPYTKKPAIFQCPERGAVPQGIAFHRSAAGMNILAFENMSKTVMYFDSDGPKRNTSDVGKSLPRLARHHAQHGILFGDGHVEMVAKPDFKFGYDAAFVRRQQEARAKNKQFWIAHAKLQRRKIAVPKKAKTP